jgi:hypothetical protein
LFGRRLGTGTCMVGGMAMIETKEVAAYTAGSRVSRLVQDGLAIGFMAC